MATCPYCGEFLEEDGESHHCAWHHRVREVGMSALAMVVGAVVSVLVLYTIDVDPSDMTILLGVVAGMVIGQAVWSQLRIYAA